MNASASYWISQRCLVLAWPSHPRVNASALVSSRKKKKRHETAWLIWIAPHGPFIRSDQSQTAARHDSNESRCFVPLLAHKHYIEHLSSSSYRFIEENYIAIIIVIELSPSPTVSTPDTSGATKYYRCHYNQWCCLHWMLRTVTNLWQRTAAAFYLWHADRNFKWFSTVALSRPV